MTSIAFTSLFLGLVLGTQTVGVAVEGPVAAVAFELDGKPVGRIAGEPWRVPVDLGRELAAHELVARALDPAGRELARARQWLNVPRPPAESSLLLERDPEGRVAAAWGATEDVSSYTKLTAAFERLRRDLDSQHMVWLEGRHLPQEIGLSEKARGIELVR